MMIKLPVSHIYLPEAQKSANTSLSTVNTVHNTSQHQQNLTRSLSVSVVDLQHTAQGAREAAAQAYRLVEEKEQVSVSQ